MKKIYISGKITGMEEEAYALFEKAESDIKKLMWEPVNPMKLKHDHDKSWQSYMRECVKALCDCHCIYMLNNYRDSPGALIELEIAIQLGIDVIFQKPK